MAQWRIATDAPFDRRDEANGDREVRVEVEANVRQAGHGARIDDVAPQAKSAERRGQGDSRTALKVGGRAHVPCALCDLKAREHDLDGVEPHRGVAHPETGASATTQRLLSQRRIDGLRNALDMRQGGVRLTRARCALE